MFVVSEQRKARRDFDILIPLPTKNKSGRALLCYQRLTYRQSGGLRRFWFIVRDYLPQLSLRSLSATMVLALMVVQVMNVGAYEAHVINVTAKIENDIPNVDPNGGQFCQQTGATVTITSTYPGASIIFTLDGTDPVCDSHGFTYVNPFPLATSTTVKTSSCHDGDQSAIVSAFFDIQMKYCPNQCTANHYASSSPTSAYLDDQTTDVTSEVAYVDNIYAEQSVDYIRYIYLNWQFPNLPSGATTTLAKLNLMHREDQVGIAVEWWNGTSWTQVCDPPEESNFTLDTCNLQPYLNTTDKVKNVKLRLKLSHPVNCHEDLDWANLEISYQQPVPCNVCGNGIVDPGEQCDDGNNISGDGCSATCQKECSANHYASSSPTSAFLNDQTTDITSKVAFTDNIYAEQAVATTSYMYLNWQFPNLPSGVTTTLAKLNLVHREDQVNIAVEWWNGANWTQICDPPEVSSFTLYSCNIQSYLNTTDKAKNVKLRLKLNYPIHCHEDLDWANLEIGYSQSVSCNVCGNGIIEQGEQCDDGSLNGTPGDSCSATCQIEKPFSCMKVNEVYYYPDSCHGGTNAEWIELYNACNFTVDLKNWYMVDNSGVNNKETITQNYPITSHQFVVIAANASVWSYWPLIPSNAIKIALGGNRLFDGLGDSHDRVFLYDNNGNNVDTVSWGSDTSAFNPAVPTVGSGHSISRKIMGVDTNTAADWMDTYYGSTPPGPNPGTNPHDANGNLILPTDDGSNLCCDYGQLATDNSDEGNPDATSTDDIIDTPSADTNMTTTTVTDIATTTTTAVATTTPDSDGGSSDQNTTGNDTASNTGNSSGGITNNNNDQATTTTDNAGSDNNQPATVDSGTNNNTDNSSNSQPTPTEQVPTDSNQPAAVPDSGSQSANQTTDSNQGVVSDTNSSPTNNQNNNSNNSNIVASPATVPDQSAPPADVPVVAPTSN